MNRSHSLILAKGLLFATFGILLVLFSDGVFFDEIPRFILTTTLLLLYLAGEILRVKRIEPERWIINPAVLCSFFTFIMGFGVTNIIYFMPQESLNSLGLYAIVTPAMNKLMGLVLLGAIAMWLAYWSPIAATLARRVKAWLETSSLIKRSMVAKRGALVACLLISFIGRILQIKAGIYGYSSDLDLLRDSAAYTQYLGMADKLGTVALVLAALQHYSGQQSLSRSRTWLVLILVSEVLFGFLSGFKTQVVMPFLIVAICQYWCVKRIPWRIIALIPVAIFCAYSVIEPFRYQRYHNVNFDNKSLGSIAETIYDVSFSGSSNSQGSNQSTALSFLGRMNTTYIASLGLEFADKEPLPEGSPRFLEDIMYSPFHAFIPRVIWKSKSLSNHGIWYSQVVMGQWYKLTTSVGMSPFTYLYFAGGFIAVILGFGAVGLLQKILNEFTNASITGGEAIVYLLFLPTIIFVDSVVSGILVNIFRMIPMLILLQYFLIAKQKTSS